MKKILFISLFLSNMTWAEQILCPQSLTCNYEKGTCESSSGDLSGWYLSSGGALESFPGDLTIQLSRAQGFKIYGGYQLNCSYSYTKSSLIILTQDKAVKLTGPKWEFYGFGKQSAMCSNIRSPEECSAEFNK